VCVCMFRYMHVYTACTYDSMPLIYIYIIHVCMHACTCLRHDASKYRVRKYNWYIHIDIYTTSTKHTRMSVCVCVCVCVSVYVYDKYKGMIKVCIYTTVEDGIDMCIQILKTRSSTNTYISMLSYVYQLRQIIYDIYIYIYTHTRDMQT
jgi:hypothetical protein